MHLPEFQRRCSYLSHQKTGSDIILVERKINKAITLLNNVKIKYINNINVLDYNCNKFGVKNAKDFEEKWNEYCKMREYEKKFRENTEMLNANNENLVIMLKELGLKMLYMDKQM